MKIFEETIPLLKGEYNQWEKVWLPILLLDALNVNKLFLGFLFPTNLNQDFKHV